MVITSVALGTKLYLLNEAITIDKSHISVSAVHFWGLDMYSMYSQIVQITNKTNKT